MTVICVVAIICALAAFIVWFRSVSKPYQSEETHADGLVEVTPLKHCFHPEDGEPKNQLCCYCGQRRLSPRPINGHGSRYEQETDIVDEECYHRSWIQ
jgi:hypothetical protein